jgi:uncharacterized protein HemX
MTWVRKNVRWLIGMAVTLVGALLVVAVTYGSLQAQQATNTDEIINLRKDDLTARRERADNNRNISVLEERLMGIVHQLQEVADRLEKKVPHW